MSAARAFLARHKKILLFSGLLLYLYFRGIGDHGLLDPLEGVNASVALQMSASGNYLVPRMGESAVAGRALGTWWLSALALRAFGWWEFSARFWPALAGLGTALAAGLAVRRRAWLTAAISASMTLGFAVSQLAASYALYACCSAFAMTAFLRASMILNEEVDEAEWDGLWRWLLLAHAAPLAGLIVHGPEGILLPWLTLAIFSVLTQRYTTLAACWTWWPGAAVSLLGTAGYLLLLRLGNPVLLFFMRCEVPKFLAPDWKLVLALILFGATPWQGFALMAVKETASQGLRALRAGAAPDAALLRKLLMTLWALVFGLAALLTGDILALSACVPAVAALVGSSFVDWLEQGKTAALQGAVAADILFLVPLAAVGAPLAIRAFPILRPALLSLVPWGVFIGVFLLAARHYVKGGRRMFEAGRQSKLTRNVSVAALLCLMPLAGVFDLAAREASLQEAGPALRGELQKNDVVAQYAVNRPSLYFYTLHSSALVNGPLLPGVASKNLVMDDMALHFLWDGKDRAFLLLPLDRQPQAPLPLNVYSIVEANGMVVLSNR